MLGKAEESVNHVLSECSKLAQKEYKRRHGWNEDSLGNMLKIWDRSERKVIRAQVGSSNRK